jgi:hypothetical protein
MIKKILLLITSFVILIFFKSFCQDGIIGKIDYQDTLLGKIDSITTFIHSPSSKFAYAMDYDSNMPDGEYALYRADTVKNELRYAVLYTYEGKFKKLTNFYFFEGKVIKVTESKTLTKRQESNKFNWYDRTYYYANDTLYHFTNNTKEDINYNMDIANAKTILRRFRIKYSSGQLDFKQNK